MPATRWAGAWVAVMLAAAGACAAQSYPGKPVRVIFAFAAGGAGDIIARAYGQKFAEKFGQGWVLDNRGGAGSTLGTDLAAKAVPDGYTSALGAEPTNSSQAEFAAMIKRDITRWKKVAVEAGIRL